MVVLVLGGCTALPIVAETTTEGGSYGVELPDEVLSEGLVDLILVVTEVGTGAPAVGVRVEVTASMPDMDHGSEPVQLVEEPDGVYVGEVGVGMPGVWDLRGDVDGEAFLLRVPVE